MQKIIDTFDVSKMDVLKNFPIFCDRKNIFSLIAHYECFRDVIEMPGDIVVIGYNSAPVLLNVVNFTEAQTIGDRTRLVVAFDCFKPTESFTTKDEYTSLRDTAVNFYNEDRFVGWKDRIQMNEGEPVEQLTAFVKVHIGLKASLVYCVGLNNSEYDAVRGIFENGHLMIGGQIVNYDGC